MDVDAYQGKIAGIIAEHGWMIQGVGGGPDSPTFSYTIGLTEFGHPELLMVGLDPRTAQSLLNTMGATVKNLGRAYSPGDRVAEVIAGFDVLLRGPIDPVKAQLIQALNMYGEIDALQVLWPDAEGRFPGEPDFNPRFLLMQPLAVLLN